MELPADFLSLERGSVNRGPKGLNWALVYAIPLAPKCR